MEENRHPAAAHRQDLCGEGLRLPLPGSQHHGGTDLERPHHRAKLIGCPLPYLEELHSCLKKAKTIVQDSLHPGHTLFKLLLSGRRYQSMKTRTNRLQNSFYPTAISA